MHSGNQPHRVSRQSGLTLLELLIVLVLLISLAGMLVPGFSNLSLHFAGEDKTPQEIATEQTLLQVRTAILGASGQKGFWPDLGGRDEYLPQKMADLFITPSSLPATLQSFDPNSRLGWRGPYLMSSGARYDASDAYGTPADPAVLDGWGHPIVIQTPDTLNIRLVSKGADGVLETPPGTGMPALSDCGDDVVLFLRVADVRS